MAKSDEKFSITAGDISMYYGRVLADQQMTFAIELAGKLDLDRLTVSLTLLYQYLPILNTVLQVKGSKFVRSRMEKREIAPQVIMNPNNQYDAVLRFVSTPTEPLKDQPLKLLLVRTGNHDTLYVKMDHVVTDGGGFKFLIDALAEAYNKGKMELPINYRRGFDQIFRRVSPWVIFREIRRTAQPSPPGPVLVEGAFEAEPHFIERAVLLPEQLERLRQNGKRYQATVNDLLLTALYRSVFRHPEIEDGMFYPVVVPVDMRRYLPENRRNCLANLTSYIHTGLEKAADEPFIGTLQRVIANMDQYKRRRPGLGTMFFITLGALKGRGPLPHGDRRENSRGPSNINLSNTGLINDDRLQFDPVPIKDAYLIPPNLYAPEILIAVSTFRNKLNLIVHGNDMKHFQPFVKNLLQSILTELEPFIIEP